MNYKFLLLLFTVTLFSNLANAQGFYIEAGTNLSDLNQPKENHIAPTKYQLGYQIGVSKDIPIKNKFSFFPKLMFAYKREYLESDFYLPDDLGFIGRNGFNINTKEYHIEVPLNFKYKFDLKTSSIYILFGPYLNVLLFDNSNAEMVLNAVSEPIEPSESQKTSFSRNLDYGLNFGVGYQKKRFIVNASMDYGLYRDISTEYSDEFSEFNTTYSNRNFTYRLQVGYQIF
ncbi:PorT family protein [Flammeovirga sp. MY04]|uniref:outer membrane beta-barrel protein n=1 Tax=Flammeovirga sp. MY04 TaxID=1191459 RepID=UPI000806431B|nr:outer membrane beta-barrel protein [Flammeovirga sp. MY04]ANQ51776.1 PorT family protein [Flammeovirga sp. MY04]